MNTMSVSRFVPQSSSEHEWVTRLKAGDPFSFEQLVDRYGARMQATALRIVGNSDAARDVVQDALLSIIKNIGGFRHGSRLSTWLHRIVVNAALARQRHSTLRPTEVEFPEGGEDLNPTPADAEQSLLVDERRNLVRSCIDRLPRDYRTILQLRELDELNADAVAGLLRVTPNAVNVRLHRARKALSSAVLAEKVAQEQTSGWIPAGTSRSAMAAGSA